MKVMEFVEKYKKIGTVKPINNLIVTKKYLPYAEKQELVKEIANRCVFADDGYIWFDEMYKYLVFTMKMISTYTDIEFDLDFDVATTEYDALCEACALNSIIETFEGEYKTVLNMLTVYQDQVLRGNTLEAQVAKFLSGLNDRIDGISNILSSTLDNYKDVDLSADSIKKLTDLISTLGK